MVAKDSAGSKGASQIIVSVPLIREFDIVPTGKHLRVVGEVEDESDVGFGSSDKVMVSLQRKAGEAGADALFMTKNIDVQRTKSKARAFLKSTTNVYYGHGYAVKYVEPTEENVLQDLEIATPEPQFISAIKWVEANGYPSAIPRLKNLLFGKGRIHIHVAQRIAQGLCAAGKTAEIQTYFAGIQHDYSQSYGTDLIFAECLRTNAANNGEYQQFWQKILQYHDNPAMRLAAAKALMLMGDSMAVKDAAEKDKSLDNRKKYSKLLLGF